MQFQTKDRYTMGDFLQIMELLRSPEGCPWDREQTHQSIRNNLIEETYEAVEAIDTGDTELLREELGDVLLQVVFHAMLEKEAGSFDFSDVVDGVAKKMILRHPHVFGDISVRNTDEVLQNWEAIKMKSHGRTSTAEALEGVSRSLPALMRGQKVFKKAARAAGLKAGPDVSVRQMGKALHEAEGLSVSSEEAERLLTVGKLLFCAAGLAQSLEIDAEQALTAFCDGYISKIKNTGDAGAASYLEMDAGSFAADPEPPVNAH